MTSMGQGDPAMTPLRERSQVEWAEVRVLQLGDEHGGHAVDGRGAFARARPPEWRAYRTAARAGSGWRPRPARPWSQSPTQSNGRAARGRRCGRRWSCAGTSSWPYPLFTRLRCVSITPLGWPVVPEVYWMLATSSGGLAWGGTSTPRASISCQEAPPMQTACSSVRALAAARLFQDGAVIGARVVFAQENCPDARLRQHEAQLVRAVCRIDVDQHQAATGAARCSRIHSTQLLAQIPTRSPGTSPRPASPRAVRSTSAANSPQVSRTSSWRTTRASPRGNRWAVSRRTSVVVFSSRGSAGPCVWLSLTGCVPGAAIEDTGLQFTSFRSSR